MIKIVMDTNVFVSGIFWSGPPSKILESWYLKKLKLTVSAEILMEYDRVGKILSKKYSGINIDQFIDLVVMHSEIYAQKKLPHPVSPDPDDDKFIACALSANVKIIVSGDSDLLQVSGYQGIKMIKPKHFVDEYLHDN